MLLAQATWLAHQIEGYQDGEGWLRRWHVIAITRRSDDPSRSEFSILAVDPNGHEHPIYSTAQWQTLKMRSRAAQAQGEK